MGYSKACLELRRVPVRLIKQLMHHGQADISTFIQLVVCQNTVADRMCHFISLTFCVKTLHCMAWVIWTGDTGIALYFHHCIPKLLS